MKIGDLSARVGVTVETVRFYERAGLVPPPERSAGNYRIYGPAHAERLRFIVNCRALDMTLDEIRGLLRFHDAPSRDCSQVNAVLDEHLDHVSARIGELKRLERQLRQLRRACDTARPGRSCGILKSLHGPRSQRTARVDVHVGRRGS